MNGFYDDEIVFKRGQLKNGEVQLPHVKQREYNDRCNERRRKHRHLTHGKTYGEAWVAHLNHPDYFKSEDFGKSPPACPKRMNFDDAITYYKAKLQNVWDELYPVKPSDFLKPDDYFDYHEAKRVVNNIIFGETNDIRTICKIIQ